MSNFDLRSGEAVVIDGYFGLKLNIVMVEVSMESYQLLQGKLQRTQAPCLE